MDQMLDMAIFSGNGNPELSRAICDYLKTRLCDCLITKFASGEIRVEIGAEENVRGKRCYIIETCVEPVNDNLMGILILADALRRASAQEINVVMPFYFYCRQDRKKVSGVPITAKLIANLLKAAGVNRIITMDLHAAQIQGFTDNPFDNLYASPIFLPYIRENLNGNLVIVAPDENAVKRAKAYANILGADLGVIIKFRDEKDPSTVSEMTELIMLRGKSIKGKNVVVLDDMIDGGGTTAGAAEIILKRKAKSVHAAATHGIFSGNAFDKLQKSGIKSVIVTDTLPIKPGHPDFVRYLPITPLLARAMEMVHKNQKLTPLFEVAM